MFSRLAILGLFSSFGLAFLRLLLIARVCSSAWHFSACLFAFGLALLRLMLDRTRFCLFCFRASLFSACLLRLMLDASHAFFRASLFSACSLVGLSFSASLCLFASSWFCRLTSNSLMCIWLDSNSLICIWLDSNSLIVCLLNSVWAQLIGTQTV